MGAWIEISLLYLIINSSASHPTMGAWIEIALTLALSACFLNVAPHDGCVDWNKNNVFECLYLNKSHPTMGAWIEI